jgi:OOP family OmpA-OmpF porin
VRAARLAIALLLGACSAPPPPPVAVAAPPPVVTAEPAPPPAAPPAPAPIRTRRAIELYTFRGPFETDSAVLRPGAVDVLDGTVWFLLSNPDFTVEIQCHTDNFGTPAHNMELSQSRAETLRSYLVSRGIAAERLTAVGYGGMRPIPHAPHGRSRRCVLLHIEEQAPVESSP